MGRQAEKLIKSIRQGTDGYEKSPIDFESRDSGTVDDSTPTRIINKTPVNLKSASNTAQMLIEKSYRGRRKVI